MSCTGISPRWSLDTGGGDEGVKSNAEDQDGWMRCEAGLPMNSVVGPLGTGFVVNWR